MGVLRAEERNQEQAADVRHYKTSRITCQHKQRHQKYHKRRPMAPESGFPLWVSCRLKEFKGLPPIVHKRGQPCNLPMKLQALEAKTPSNDVHFPSTEKHSYTVHLEWYFCSFPTKKGRKRRERILLENSKAFHLHEITNIS